jgi:hypothetical protein
MLQWTAAGGGPCFCLIVRHDGARGGWAYDRNSYVGRLKRPGTKPSPKAGPSSA